MILGVKIKRNKIYGRRSLGCSDKMCCVRFVFMSWGGGGGGFSCLGLKDPPL